MIMGYIYEGTYKYNSYYKYIYIYIYLHTIINNKY